MRESKSKDIDGLLLTVQQLPAMRSTLLMHKLGKAVGPALAKMVSGKGVTSLADMDLGGIADGVQMLFDRFSADDLSSLMKELFESSTLEVNGNTFPMMKVFDNEFAGKPGAVLTAIQFALEVNYGDFLGALLANAGKLMKAQSPLKG